MKPTENKELAAKLSAFKQEFQRNHGEAVKVIYPDLVQFLVALGSEGERSAVVLGAERVNVALEELLKAFLRPSLTKEDTLFSSDGALATFSRKIELAYRLGLIDLQFRRALNFVRKLRNDFAHAIKVESLELQSHADKVRELRKLMTLGGQQSLEGLEQAFVKGAAAGELLSAHLGCIMLLLIKLEFVRHHLKRPDILLPAKLDYRDDKSD